MAIQIYSKDQQAYGAFNNGEIVENKPIGFPREGGSVKPYSNLFYWANAIANVDSEIGLHPHQGFEILSFVLDDEIRHYDTQMNAWKNLKAGDVQIIRAGNGISHAEFMAKNARMFQIWLDPDLDKTLRKPASYSDYKSHEFPVDESQEGVAIKHLIGNGSPLELDTAGISIFQIQMTDGSYIHEVSDAEVLSVYALQGKMEISGTEVKADDFAIIRDESIRIVGTGSLFVIQSQKELPYKTYAQRLVRPA